MLEKFANLYNQVQDRFEPTKNGSVPTVSNPVGFNPKKHVSILLVEKNQFVLQSKKTALEKCGYHITTINSCNQSIQSIPNAKDLNLILFDIHFLLHSEGTHWIKSNEKIFNIPVLFLYDSRKFKTLPDHKEITAYGLIAKNSHNSILSSAIQMAIQRDTAIKQLSESEKRFRYLLDNSFDSVSIIEENILSYVSKGRNDLLGYEVKDNTHTTQDQIHSLIHKEDISHVKETIESSIREGKKTFKYNYRVKTKNGNYIWVEDHVYAEYDAKGNNTRSSIYTRDINDHKLTEDNMKKLLLEKEIILKEVHHRIKNNMTTIIALLELQADTLKIPLATAALEEASKRMRSMMLLYDKLYRSTNYKELYIKEYLSTLVDEIVNNFPNRDQVGIEKSIDDFPISTEKLVPLGILINELLTNTMKYAFLGRDKGKITIQAYIKEDQFVCIIEDNGNGLPESIDFKNSKGFGLYLVEILNRQLNGNLKVERTNGTKIILEFKL